MASLAPVLLAAVLLGMAPVAEGAVSHTFTTISEELMHVESIDFILPDEPFIITNDTGITWIDFHVRLFGYGQFGEYPFMRFIELGADGNIYTGPGIASFVDDNLDGLGYDEVMNLDGLSIADGATLEFTVDIIGGVAPEGLVEFEIYGLPSIPEPCTVGLFGLGTLALIRRRRRA